MKNDKLNETTMKYLKMTKSEEMHFCLRCRGLETIANSPLEIHRHLFTKLTPAEQEHINNYYGLSNDELGELFVEFDRLMSGIIDYPEIVENDKESYMLSRDTQRLVYALFARLGYFK